MSSIHKTKYGTWSVSYADGDGRRTTRSFPSRDDARDFKTEIDHDNLVGGGINRALGRSTVHDFASPWFNSLTVKPKTKDGYRQHYNTWVMPHWGNTPVNQIERPDIRAWAMSITEVHGRSQSVRDQAVNALRSILNFAVERRAIKANPATKLKLPKLLTLHEMTFLTPAEIRRLALTCATKPNVKKGEHPVHQLIIEFAAFTGLRAGEIWAMRWCDIDLERGDVIVQRSASSLDDGSVVIGLTKTSRSRRVPMPSWLTKKMANHKFLSLGKPQDLAFPNSDGGVMRHSNFMTNVFTPAREEIGCPSLRFHDLRHTYASLLIANGADPKIIQRRMGHSTISITFDLYGHVMPEKDIAITEALGSLYLDDEQAARLAEDGKIVPLVARQSE